MSRAVEGGVKGLFRNLSPALPVTLLAAVLLVAPVPGGETDRIYTTDGRVVECYVNWVLSDHIEYTRLSAPDSFSLIDKDSVEKVVFSDGREIGFSLRLFLRDGDIISGRLVSEDAAEIKIKTRYGLLDVPREAVARREPAGGLGLGLGFAAAVETLTVDTVPLEAERFASLLPVSIDTPAVDSLLMAPPPVIMEEVSPAGEMETPPSEEVEDGAITGQVLSFQDLSSPNRPDPGAELVIYRDGMEAGRVTANEEGIYSFSSPPGTYTVVCRFKRQVGSKAASGIEVESGKETGVDFIFTYLDLTADKYRGKGIWTLDENKNVVTGEITPL